MMPYAPTNAGNHVASNSACALMPAIPQTVLSLDWLI